MEAVKSPLQLRNPKTQEVYFLIREDVYRLTCSILAPFNRNGWDDDDDLFREGA
jgi:hypothetical protein